MKRSLVMWTSFFSLSRSLFLSLSLCVIGFVLLSVTITATIQHTHIRNFVNVKVPPACQKLKPDAKRLLFQKKKKRTKGLVGVRLYVLSLTACKKNKKSDIKYLTSIPAS